MLFCRRCGNRLPGEATVCGHCEYRIKPAVYCRRCAAELPGNGIRCLVCNTKSSAHKKGVHWLPIPLSIVAFFCWAFGGYYQLDRHSGMYVPYTTALDFIALALAGIGLIVAVFVIPRTRVALKIISILLSGIMMYFAIDWILHVIL